MTVFIDEEYTFDIYPVQAPRKRSREDGVAATRTEIDAVGCSAAWSRRLIDALLDGLPEAKHDAGRALRGRIAIANAKIAYEAQERIVETDRWKTLRARGARPQRLLWASTSSKDPRYADTYYVEALVGPSTVDTMTLDTFRAYLAHGRPEARLAVDRAGAHRALRDLGSLGIELERVAEDLEAEGVASFTESFRRTLRAIAERRRFLAA
jgi:transaldolase